MLFSGGLHIMIHGPFCCRFGAYLSRDPSSLEWVISKDYTSYERHHSFCPQLDTSSPLGKGDG